MASFLDDLLVHPNVAVVWLDEDTRDKAPLFVSARYGKGNEAHTCVVQFGCRYCEHQMELLYFAANESGRRQQAHDVMLKLVLASHALGSDSTFWHEAWIRLAA